MTRAGEGTQKGHQRACTGADTWDVACRSVPVGVQHSGKAFEHGPQLSLRSCHLSTGFWLLLKTQRSQGHRPPAT